jgi:hypothetical protein
LWFEEKLVEKRKYGNFEISKVRNKYQCLSYKLSARFFDSQNNTILDLQKEKHRCTQTAKFKLAKNIN